MGVDCVSPSGHSAFSTPVELVQFVARMRALSGGKPAGFKLCVGQPGEFLAVCKAMLETGFYPDFIVVDGKEGGTGAAPLEFMDHLGMPMRDGLNFVHNALIGVGAARQGPDRRRRQDRHRLRHRARHGARRRLVQRGARLHVRARLHPVANPATPTAARPASPRKIRSASARSSSTDKTERVHNFHRATLRCSRN